jgi:hypothetical protein
MKVTRKITFNEYWIGPEFQDKKPVRNGSKKMIVGDNIYYQDPISKQWSQAHSHHSLPDGAPNEDNLKHDTQSNFVLLSKHFYYFGSSAPVVPSQILSSIGYRNGRQHRTYEWPKGSLLVNWIETNFWNSRNHVLADPFNFDRSQAHYSVRTNQVTS